MPQLVLWTVLGLTVLYLLCRAIVRTVWVHRVRAWRAYEEAFGDYSHVPLEARKARGGERVKPGGIGASANPAQRNIEATEWSHRAGL